MGSRLLQVAQSVSLNILWLMFILFCNWDPSKNGEIMELQCNNNHDKITAVIINSKVVK